MEAGCGGSLVEEPEEVGLVDLVHLITGMQVDICSGVPGRHPGDEAFPDA